ncbi:hypothetical protein [Thermococcus sp.]|uniref:hypothetical protein n=1 Tax=Thermococcus sp. TaxID=35749 RepID=UPI0025D41977|nr:hypothetical protein [Thermococcus sp.]
MDIAARFRSVFRVWKAQIKSLTYMQVRCGVLSECIKWTERRLNSLGLQYTILIDPDQYTLTAVAEAFYERGKFLGVLELKDELSRAFYLIESNLPIDLRDIPGLEFTLTFRVRKKEGLAALLKVIHGGRAGGARHKHRSTLNFLTSFLGSIIISTVIDLESYWAQLIVMLVLTALLFLILDYPFSLLYFKGVEVVSTRNREEKILIVKIKGPKERSV